MATIDISVTVSDLTKKVKQHLAVIGKRAKDVNGRPMFSDLTTSTAEDTAVWSDLYDSGASKLIATIPELCSTYTYDASAGTITFKVISTRWTDENETTDKYDITTVLKNEIERYIWNYAIMEFLSMIHPSTGEKYPPIFGSTYQSALTSSILAIRSLAYKKMPAKESAVDYSSVKGCVTRTLKAVVSPESAGTVTGAGEYADGATAELTAEPATGYFFSSWKENGEVISEEESLEFEVSKDTTLVAEFTESCNITIETGGSKTYRGFVESGGTLYDGGTVEKGSTLSLTAVPSAGAMFDAWTIDDGSSSTVSYENPLTLTVNSDLTITATFDKQE